MNIENFIRAGAHFIKIQRYGKIPVEKWKDVPRPSAQTVFDWIEDFYNVAVKTGDLFFVVDIDEKTFYDNFKKEYEIPDTFRVSTPRGWHLYFRSPDFEVKNCVNILPKIDIRGKGGIAITPPSVIKKKEGTTGYFSIDKLICKASPLLLDLLRPKPLPTPQKFHYKGDMRKYEKSALENEINDVLTSSPGTRNDTLHRACFNLATIATMNEGIIRAKLTIAGMRVGLPESEILATLNSGITAGRQNLR